MLLVPIGSGDQVLGAVHLYYVRPPENLPSAETLQRARNQGLQVLVDILDTSVQSHARSQGNFLIIQQIGELCGADWCELSSLGGGRNTLVVSASIGTGVWLESSYSYINLSKYPDMLRALQSQTPIHEQVGNGELSSGSRNLLETTRSRSILALPLIQRGVTEGMVLFADTRVNRIFGEREINLARAIVGQAATTLENARLVHDLERSLQELHETQDRLVQSARLSATGSLAAVVAHQINNPLTTILVDTELMLLEVPKKSPNYDSLIAIQRAGKRAAGVARRLLSFVRPDDANPLDGQLDVVDTINDVLSLVKAHVEYNKVKILVDLPSKSLPPVKAARGQLEDIWLNLLLNAQDALIGHEDAKVGLKVVYSPEKNQVIVTVWDNGPGIPEDVKAKIFEPFFTTKRPGSGTGLGLYICRQVIKRVGGSIEVESNVGSGARFIVCLPVASTSKLIMVDEEE